jgi:hypothetical protein
VRESLAPPRNAAKTASLASKRHAEKDGPNLRPGKAKPRPFSRTGVDARQKRQAYLLLQVPKPEITVSAEAKLPEAAGLA